MRKLFFFILLNSFIYYKYLAILNTLYPPVPAKFTGTARSPDLSLDALVHLHVLLDLVSSLHEVLLRLPLLLLHQLEPRLQMRLQIIRQ